MHAQIVTPQNRSYELRPILTEVGLCYTFNSRIADLFNPLKSISDARSGKNIQLYKLNFYDLETEGTLTYTYTGSNFDVSQVIEKLLSHTIEHFIKFDRFTCMVKWSCRLISR